MANKLYRSQKTTRVSRAASVDETRSAASRIASDTLASWDANLMERAASVSSAGGLKNVQWIGSTRSASGAARITATYSASKLRGLAIELAELKSAPVGAAAKTKTKT